MLYAEAGFPFWISVPLAAVVAGIVGALLGIPCLRVRDDFLAITTMGINFVVEAIFLYIPFLAEQWASEESTFQNGLDVK